VAGFLIKIAVQTMLEYRAELLGWLIANPVQFILGLATIKFVIAEFGTLGGWTFGELAFLYGIGVLSHGLSVILFVQTWYMGRAILDGEFDIYMLRPMNVLFQFFLSWFNLIGITDMIPGAVIFIYGCSQVHFVWSFVNILMIVSVLIGATLIRGAVFLLTGSLAFWTKSRSSFVLLNFTIFDQTTKYPLPIYPRAMQAIFTFLIPIGFIAFYPANDFLGKSGGNIFSGLMPWVALAVGVFVFWAATRVFRRGLKKYESAGT
jgi:ABC-2 type transport system permease protein